MTLDEASLLNQGQFRAPPQLGDEILQPLGSTSWGESLQCPCSSDHFLANNEQRAPPLQEKEGCLSPIQCNLEHSTHLVPFPAQGGPTQLSA